MTVKVADHSTFFEKLHEFLQYLAQTHPGTGGPEKALSFLTAFRALPETHERMSFAWLTFSRPIKEAIRDGDAATVATAFDTADNTIIRNIDAGNILLSEQPDELVWVHLRGLTLLSENLHQSAAQPTQQQHVIQLPPATPPAAKQQQQQPNEVIKNIASAIPEIFKGLNDALKQDDGNNPLATIFKQLTSNGPVQESSQLPVDAGATEILNRTGLSAEDIVQKLKRLSVLEKYYERRKGKSQE
jgi:hypothetical protein